MVIIRKIFQSFIPYLIVLVGIFVIVIILDKYAKNISEEAEVINIKMEPSQEGENILQFETDDIAMSESETRVKSDSIYILSVSLYRDKKYEQSKELLKRLELRFTDDASVMNYLGLILLKEKRFGEAQLYFSKAISSDSTFFAAFINYAVVSSKMRQDRNAEKAYRQAMRINPLNPKPYYNLGLLFSSTNSWEEAAEEFRKSIDLSSSNEKAKSLCYYGIAQLNLRDTAMAKNSFNKAIEYKPGYQLPRVYLALISPDNSIREEELTKVYRLNPNSYYANYYLGKLYKEENQFSSAEYHLRKALEINPDDDKIIEELSSFLINQDRFDEAKLVIAGFSLYDTLPQTYFHEARMATKRGEIDEAITLYGLALEKSEHNYPEAALNQAILYKQINEIQKAIASYQQATKMKRDYSIAYYNLALLYSEIGNTPKAISNYKLAISFNNKSSKSWYNLASIYEENEQIENAIDAYLQAIAAEPHYLKALSALGVLYAKLERFDKAIETYQLLLKQYPNYARGYYNLGLAYNKSKQYTEAINAYARVIEIDPENIKAKTNIGVLYARTNNIELAIKTFEDAADIEVDNPEIRYNLALQYEKTERFSDAVYQYTRAIQLDEGYEKAYITLSNLYEHMGEMKNAHFISFRRLTQFPDQKELYELGKKFREEGEYEYAIKSFDLVQEHGAKNKWVIYWTGMTYMDMENIDKAIRCFEEVTELDSKHKFAYYRLGQTYEVQGLQAKADNYYKELLKLDPDFKIGSKNQVNVEAI